MTSVHQVLDPAQLISIARFEAYLAAANNDIQRATELYEWSTRLSSACFEALSYVEIILRNSIDQVMSGLMDERKRGIPWFLMSLSSVGVEAKNQKPIDDQIEDARRLLRNEKISESRDQIIAKLSLGFWTNLIAHNGELWSSGLGQAFPGAQTKSDVIPALERLRVFRNRLAHHDSLLQADIPLRLLEMRLLLRTLNETGLAWFDQVERISSTLHDRPGSFANTAVLAARDAWPLYRSVPIYLCPPGRSFRPVDHLAFYADQEIKKEVPKIIRRSDNVRWSSREAARLLRSPDQLDRRLGNAMNVGLANGWREGRYQIFELTQPGDHGHLTLRHSLEHPGRGPGSAFTMGRRYVSSDALRSAVTTNDLD